VLFTLATKYSNKFFVKDSENPYTSDPGKHFAWIRGRQVGGKSLNLGTPELPLERSRLRANIKDGIAVDWPIRYATLRRGTTTSKNSPNQRPGPKVCRSSRTVNFFHPWK